MNQDFQEERASRILLREPKANDSPQEESLVNKRRVGQGLQSSGLRPLGLSPPLPVPCSAIPTAEASPHQSSIRLDSRKQEPDQAPADSGLLLATP